ncbi:MAG: hypothetical protein LAP40_23840 [Acidobacteriia bacterium]|nr:hypothetical protein [Terriglobia bacterium]
MRRATLWTTAVLAGVTALSAQGPPRGPQRAPSTAKAAAPVDFTGYWVSPVMEDWRWRMVTPIKGDFASVPINRAAYDLGLTWDPAKDEAAGLQCKAYGAPALMRIPGRLHITWQDDNTLQVETDAGTQTRVFHFTGKAPGNEAASWQGYSEANWERPVRGEGDPRNDVPPIFSTRTGARGKSLEVVTTHLRAGYLRKNGVPYSENTTLEEFYDTRKAPDGNEWFTVTTVVHDPKYLTVPFITSTDFKKQADAAGWHPTPCSAR